MWLSILLIVMLFAIALIQSAQGFFSSLIMCVLTIGCGAAAIGLSEWVAANYLATLWKPDYALPLAVGLILGVPLLVIRIFLDRFIRRSPLIPLWVERVGAGVCGLITALIVVGVLAHAVQMLPFGDSVLGFKRVSTIRPDKDLNDPATIPSQEELDKEQDLWLSLDRFAVGVASMVSGGIFSGSVSLADHYPDLVQATGWVQSVPPGVPRYAAPGSINFVRAARVPFVYREIPPPSGSQRRSRARQDAEEIIPTVYESIQPKSGHEFWMVRVRLIFGGKKDSPPLIFSLRQFRLVGRGQDGRLEQYHPIAIQQNLEGTTAAALQTNVNRHIRFRKVGTGELPLTDYVFTPLADNNGQVETVYELPEGFDPSFVEYKRLARATASFDQSADDAGDSPKSHQPDAITFAAPSAAPSTSSPTPGDAPKNPTRGGNIRRATSRAEESFFGDRLPMTLRSYQAHKNAEISRGAMASGHLVGFTDEQNNGQDPEVSRFSVPSDKHLLQLSTKLLKARSTLGRAMSFAVGTLQNYFVEDSNGNRYVVVGKYAISDDDGREVIEVQYFSERAGTVGQLGKFIRLKEDDLKEDDEFFLLFLVDPGAHITAFSTGGAATRRDDLSQDNLIAPN